VQVDRVRIHRGLVVLVTGLTLSVGMTTAPADRRERAAAPPAPMANPSGPAITATPLRTPSPEPRTTPKPAARPTETRPATVTLVMNGDLLWHNTFWYGAREDARRRGRFGFDFAPTLAGIRSVVASADVAICHEEPPLAAAGGPFLNFPRFSVPPQVVTAIKATGYDVCTTASNHSVDHGFAGLKRTLDAFDRAGIPHNGMARTVAESRRPTIVTTRSGVRVAVISGTFSTNGIPKPAGKPWSVTGLEPRDLLARARQARAAGADIVVVAAHVGTEYSSQVNAQQRALAESLTASPDVDLLYMHHTHVVQPWTKVNGKWVIYGLGNTVAQHEPSLPQGSEGVTARLRFERGQDGRFTVTRAEYIPTLVTRYTPGRPSRLHQVSAALPKARGAFRSRLLEAQRRTTAVVTRYRPPGLVRG
jgi:poly-gamma-glutamate capsule biosynthesis protein CapA/YwtB (metallophosphatase superfamily)